MKYSKVLGLIALSVASFTIGSLWHKHSLLEFDHYMTVSPIDGYQQ
ncbi:MAG: hypothetical protein ACRBHB_07855 [Arenicella sp.]